MTKSHLGGSPRCQRISEVTSCTSSNKKLAKLGGFEIGGIRKGPQLFERAHFSWKWTLRPANNLIMLLLENAITIRTGTASAGACWCVKINTAKLGSVPWSCAASLEAGSVILEVSKCVVSLSLSLRPSLPQPIKVCCAWSVYICSDIC